MERHRDERDTKKGEKRGILVRVRKGNSYAVNQLVSR